MEGSQIKSPNPGTFDNESDLRKNLQGIITITKREFFANLKNFRMAVLIFIFILTVLGGAYLSSGFLISGDINDQPDLLIWSILTDADDELYLNDGLFYITDLEGNPLTGAEVRIEDDDDNILLSETTNSTGIVIWNNVSMDVFNFKSGISLTVKYQDEKVETAPILPPIPVPQTQYVQAQLIDIDDDNVQDDIVIIVIDPTGRPLENAIIVVETDETENNFNGTTDANGFFTKKSLKGPEEVGFGGFGSDGGGDTRDYTVYVDPDPTGNSDIKTEFAVFEDDESRAQALKIEGPDEVIGFLAGSFIVLIAPIIAIALAFDSVAKERIQNSLDFLLCRPLGRRSIILGKFFGILLAIAIPTSIVNIVAIMVIAGATGEPASFTLAAGFILLTILFIAIFILLQQIFSTLAKTTGTAIMSGISIWLLFGMFWGLISLAVNFAIGNAFLSDNWIILSNRIDLINPGGSYGQIMSLLAGNEIMGVEAWMPAVAITVWFVLVFVLSLEIFRLKANV
ncbi:MAG: ABC transporter permease subunit [Thermoplasmata archaeon]|nr:ABC transporter permease subunit [Thermoplasmata archaeon]